MKVTRRNKKAQWQVQKAENSAPSTVSPFVNPTAAITMPTNTFMTFPMDLPPKKITTTSFGDLSDKVDQFKREFDEQVKIVEINQVIETVKKAQQSLEDELKLAVNQQKELLALAPIEKAAEISEQMNVESLDSQLKQISEKLAELINQLYQTNEDQGSNEPMIQIDISAKRISAKLDQLSETRDALRREIRKSIRLSM